MRDDFGRPHHIPCRRHFTLAHKLMVLSYDRTTDTFHIFAIAFPPSNLQTFVTHKCFDTYVH